MAIGKRIASLLGRRITYANVAATLALVLAMSGAALAAHHYLITSTKQISPGVLKKLHGARGARGITGFIGPIGPQGPVGEAGPRGGRGPTGPDGFSALSNLPGGETESGDFAFTQPAAGAASKLLGAISFPIPLAAPLAAKNVIVTNVPAKPEPGEKCPGPGQAARGYLCIYTTLTSNAEKPEATNPEVTPVTEGSGSGRHGVRLVWAAPASSVAEAAGTWSATG
ncbi:MAG: hypothetical protein ACYDC2_06025 [Solirubrobacteraceae bacterium]